MHKKRKQELTKSTKHVKFLNKSMLYLIVSRIRHFSPINNGL